MLTSFWLLPLAAALAGPAPAPPVTTLSGHFDHAPAGDSVRLVVGFRNVSAALSPGGDFSFTLPEVQRSLPTKFRYADQETTLYLMPGDQLVMRLDFQDFDKSLVYSGRGSVVNNYLAQSLYKFAYGPPGDLLRPNDFPKGTLADAHRTADALRQARRAYLAGYAKAHPLPTEFMHDEQLSINITWATQQLAYAYLNDSGPLPADYFNFMAGVPAKELDRQSLRSLIDNSLLANFLMGYQGRLVPMGKLSTDPAEGLRIYQLATQELGDTRARNWEMEFLLSTNTRNNVLGAQTFYQTFKQHTPDSTLSRNMRAGLRARLAGLAHMQPGQPAPAFTLRDAAGKPVSLSDFKGKVVYLDFWGTWCGPCMREMAEFAPTLKKQFEERDVVFLYVSVGDPEAKWQQTIEEKHFGSPNSVHLRAADNILAESYQVNGYPSYYLIGRDGRLVQPYTSRPSDGAKTVAAIEEALKK